MSLSEKTTTMNDDDYNVADAAPQSRGNTENRWFRVRDHAGRGEPSNRKTTSVVRQSVDNHHTAEETEVLLHGGKKTALLSNVHAEELYSGVRGEFHTAALQLCDVLHAK